MGAGGVVGVFGVGLGVFGVGFGVSVGTLAGSFGTGLDGGLAPGLGFTLGDGIILCSSGLITGCVFGLISTSLSIVAVPFLRFTDSFPTVI